MNTSTDFASLLVPIAPDNPAGDNLEYDPLFDDIRASRESDPDFLTGDEWSVSEPRKADWERVRALTARALGEQSKDLQLACWLVESLCHLQGLPGLTEGMRFLSEFISRFWFQCWPLPEEDGPAVRRGRLARLDRDISQQLSCQPVLQQANTSLICWRQIQAFEHRINATPDLRDELIAQEGDLTMAAFDRSALRFSPAEIRHQAEHVKTLAEIMTELDTRYLSLSQDPDGEVFMNTRRTLTEMADYLQRLAQRVFGQPEEIAAQPLKKTEEAGPSQHYGEVMNRERAVGQMLAIARYFRQTEPSSPVPFLMERAARWADMTLTEWLEEMLTDNSSMREITHVLTGKTTP